MSTSDNKYGGCANIREFLVAPVSAIGTQIQNGYFSYPELDVDGLPNGTTLHHSVASHLLANPNRSVKYTNDGLYFYYGMESSDRKNDTKDLKTFVKANGLTLGTEDDTLMNGDEFWVLNLPELEEWIKITPHNIAEEVL